MPLNFENVNLDSIDVVDDEEQNDLIRSNVSEAVKINPDEHAVNRKASEESGVPQFAVDDSVKEKLSFDKIDFKDIEKRTPKTATYLTNFDNAVVAQDDIDVLQGIEDVFKWGKQKAESFGAAAAQATIGISESIFRTPEAIQRHIENIVNLASPILPDSVEETIIKGNPFAALAYGVKGVTPEGQGANAVANAISDTQEILTGSGNFETFTRLKEKGQQADDAFKAALNGDFSKIGDILTDADAWAGFIGNAAPSLYTAYKSGGSPLFIAWIEGMEIASDAADFERQTGVKVSPQEFAQAQIQVMAINTWLEKFGLDKVLNTEGKHIISNIIKSGASEGTTEVLQEFNTNFAKFLSYNPNTDLTQGLLPAFMGGFGSGTAGSTASNIANKLQNRETEVENNGKVEQAKLDQLNTLAHGSNLRVRDKESFKQFINEVDGENNTHVFIDASQAALYMQDKTPEEIAKDPALQLIDKQLKEARNLDTDVQIPVADFAADVAGTEHFDALRNSMTMSDETTSPFRQEQVKQETESYIQNLMQEAEQNVSEYSQAQDIYAQVRDQLIDTGTVTSANASIMAQVVPAWATAKAKREGKSVEQVYQDAGLTIEGPQTGEKARLEGEVFEQVPDSAFNGDLDYALENAFSAEAESVPLQNVGFTPDEIASLNEVGLATEGVMSREQYNNWFEERSRRLQPKPVAPVEQRATITPENVARERRKIRNSKAREEYDKMNREELINLLLRHELTGIRGRRSFIIDVQDAKAVASIDADSLKWINDNLSPDHGDALLQAVADVLVEQTDGAYHISGDEFYVLGDTVEEVQDVVDKANEKLKTAVIEATKPDGTTITLNGLNITYGIGEAKDVADQKLKQEKVRREKTGERAPRGEQPLGSSIRSAEGVEIEGYVSEQVEFEQAPVEEEKDLYIAHNLSIDNLLHADKMGGLAVPSLAIARTGTGFEGFGEISLIADKGILSDPYAKTFGADIYSPRYPSISYQIDWKQYRKIIDPLDEHLKEIGVPTLRADLESRGAQELYYDTGARYLFFEAQDKAPKLTYKKKETIPKNLRKFKGTKYGIVTTEGFKEAAEQYYRDKAERMAEEITEGGKAGKDYDFWLKDWMDTYFDEDGDVRTRFIDELAYTIEKYHQPKEVDSYELDQKLANKLRSAKSQQEFKTWLDDTFSSVISNERIFRGFTPAGNRKYVAHTLDNVVKIMKKQLRGGENFNYGVGTIRSATAPQFKTIKRIQEAKHKIVSKDVMKQLKEESSDEFGEIVEELRPYYKYDQSGFGFLDAAAENLFDMARGRGLPDFENVPDDVRTTAAEFLAKLRDMPTEYFETKIQRSVDINEFDTAIIPKDTPAEVIQLLKDQGLSVKKYNPKVEGDRAAVIAKQKQLLFQEGAKERAQARGYYDPSNSVIRLTEASDLSTFLHEFAHFMYEMEVNGNTDLLQSINNWYKRNAADVAKEANKYLGTEYDALKQGVVLDLPEDRIDIYRYLTGFDGRTKAQLIDKTVAVIDKHDELYIPSTNEVPVLTDVILNQIPDPVLVYTSKPDKIATVWSRNGDAYQIVTDKVFLIDKTIEEGQYLSENDGMTLNILQRVFREIRLSDPAEQERERIRSLRREETSRRQQRIREVPEVSPDFDIALQELADYSENFEEFKALLSPDLFDISDRNRTRLGRATIALEPYEYENAGRGNVTIYRALPIGEEIEAGDWVSFDEDYARMHETNVGEEGGTTESMEVSGEDVWWYGADQNEWVYIPSDTWDVDSLEELWNNLAPEKPLTYPKIEGGPLFAQQQPPEGMEGSITADDVTAFLDNGTSDDMVKDKAIRRAVHEQFARGFETYLMEGKAPSVELRNAFRTFARWLARIYQAMRGRLNVNLDNEMRQVFDRMLATEEQIAAAEARAKYEPMFTDAAIAGMTDEQFAEYQKRQEKVKDIQTETLRDKLIKQLTRQTQKWWNEEKQDLIDEETEKLSKEQVHAARVRLKDGDIKLDHATVKEMIGEEKTDKRGRTFTTISPKLRGMTAKGQEGVHPDQAAAFFGYRSGAEMLDDLVKAPSLKEQAETNAEARMVEIHGDIMTDGTIEKEADDAVQNEERGKLILAELRALQKGTAVPRVDRATIKELAIQNIGKLAFREIFPGKYRKAEIRAAQEAARMLAEGNKEGAAAAKMRQVMNYYLGMEATKAKNETMKIVDRMARYNKKKVREEIMKAENGYWDQLARILSRFEFRKSATLKEVESLNTWVKQRMEDDGDGLVISNAVLNESYVTHWKNVPYSDLLGINDSVKNIEHVARYANKLTRIQEEIDFNKLVDRWVTSMDKNVKTRFKSKRIDVVEGRNWGRWLMAQMTKIPFMASWLDGGERAGISHQILVQPFTEAYNQEIKLWDSVGKVVMDAILNRSKEDMKRHNAKVYIPEIDDNLMGHQILAVALNTGNQGNLKKLLLGENWANPEDEADITFDNAKLQAVLSHMTKSDWDLVQLIWDQMEKLYPQLAEVHRRTTGLTPPKVESTPIETQYGTYRGGYYPVKYDANRDLKAELNEDKLNAETESMFSNTSSIQAAVNAGATNERTGYYGPIRLSLDVVSAHFQETIHYITHHDPVREVNRLIRNKQVASMIKEKLGPEEYAQLKPWLNDIAKDGREAPTKMFWDDMLSRLRFGLTLGIMGFKASTGIIQISGLSNTVAEVGTANTAQAMRSVLGSVTTMRDAWNFAVENSNVLEHRAKTMDREIKNAMKKLEKKRGILAGAQEVSMKHIALIQTYMVDLPSWHAAYIKGMKEWGDEQRAFQYADWVIENVQGSGATKDLARIMRGQSETGRMFTMFMTFFSSLWNMERDLVKGAKSGRYSVTSVAAKSMFLFVVPVLFEMMMRGELAPPDDGDDDERLQKMMLNTSLFPLQSVPFVRDIANASLGEYGYNITPLQAVIEQGTKTIPEIVKRGFTDEEITKGQVKGATKFIGATVGIPGVNQMWATGEHLYQVIEDGEEFTMHQFLFGPERK